MEVQQKVILFSRVSLDNDIQDPVVQLRVLRDYADRKGYEIAKESQEFERGWKTLADRATFKEALDLMSTSNIDGLICLRVDRLIRDDEIKMDVKNFLKANPTKWIEYSDTGKRWDININLDDEFVNDINIAVSKRESKMLSRRIRQGKAAMQIVNGKRIGRHGKFEGRPAYMAKDPVTGKYTRFIDPKTIMSLRNEGLSMGDISRQLKCSTKLVWRVLNEGKK